MMLNPRTGVALPSIVGGLAFWIPVLIVNKEAAELGAEANAIWWHTALMPAWSLLLWWSFVSKSPSQLQRVGVPLGSLLVAWFVGPLMLGNAALMIMSPITTFLLASHTGAMFGLIIASVVVVALALKGFRRLPGSNEGIHHEQAAGV